MRREPVDIVERGQDQPGLRAVDDMDQACRLAARAAAIEESIRSVM